MVEGAGFARAEEGTMTGLYGPGSVVTVRAILLGELIDLKGLESTQRLATSPLVISTEEGQYAALFRYGPLRGQPAPGSHVRGPAGAPRRPALREA
jgi:hypothetical protein